LRALQEILFGAFLVSATGVIHALATALAFRIGQARVRGPSRRGRDAVRVRLTVLVAALFFAAHVLEAAGWAGLGWIRGFFASYADALEFSLGAYTTVGAPGLSLPPGATLWGPIEAATGMIMFGWSTGVLATIVLRHVEAEEQGDRP
jgi:hypothetical protein